MHFTCPAVMLSSMLLSYAWFALAMLMATRISGLYIAWICQLILMCVISIAAAYGHAY
jgi:hypothetical protein